MMHHRSHPYLFTLKESTYACFLLIFIAAIFTELRGVEVSITQFSSPAINSGQMIDLGRLPGGDETETTAYGINNSGQVVGDGHAADSHFHAFLYSDGRMTDLGTLGRYESHAYGINNSGQVVGSTYILNVSSEAFLYSNGTMSDIPTLGGVGGIAFGINDSGQVVGVSLLAGNRIDHAFLYNSSNGQIQDLGTLPGDTQSEALGINNSGQVVGLSFAADNSPHAFLYSGGHMINLGTLAGPNSRAVGINDSGQVIGYGHTSNGNEFCFLYNSSNGQMINLSSTFFAYGINNSGQLAGNMNGHAFIYRISDGQMIDLGTLDSDGQSEAHGINDSGQVIGRSIGSSYRGFLYRNSSTDLSITNIGLPLQVASGANISYALTITNNGPATADSITVRDNLPAQVSFVSCTTSTGICGGSSNNRTVMFSSLASGATELITIVANVNSSVAVGTVISNTATVSSFTPDSDSTNNSKNTSVTVQQISINLPVQRWSQGGMSDWAANTYDHHPGTTIGQNGCALTSLAMALRFAGVTTLPNNASLDPGALNAFMNSQSADYNQNHDVVFSNSARDASLNLTWNNLAANANASDVINILGQGYPVIARVTNPNSGAGHYVLITGVQQNGVFTIQDPGYSSRTTLAPYGNQFSARGYVAPVVAPNRLNSTNAMLGAKPLASLSLDRSALNFAVGDAVSILVVDQAGRRTGVDSNTGQIFEEIPNSNYYLDGLADDIADGPTTETDHTINISMPSQGSYTVILSGRKAGTYEVRTGIYSQDGSTQPPLFMTGTSTVGATSSYQMQFTPTPVITLLTEEGSNKVVALDSVTFVRDPFSVVTTQNFSLDHRTRLTLYAGNLKLLPGETASVVTAQAEDSQHRTYPLTVEYVGEVSPFNWLTQVVVKLPDEISHAGDVLVNIGLHGATSNKAAIRIN